MTPHVSALLFHGSTLDHLLSTYGYAAVFAFIAVESLGIPFPGETMLIAASIYASTTHRLEIVLVIVAAAAGAIVGDNIGFALGRWGGFRLLSRYGRYVRLHPGRLKLGRYVFMRHGAKVVFFGRFVSILRTYAAFLAGTNQMGWRRFLFFNAAGGVVWAVIYGTAYYFLGSVFKRLSTPIDIALGAAAAAFVVAFLLFLKRNERRLEAEAERAFPDGLAAEPREERSEGGDSAPETVSGREPSG